MTSEGWISLFGLLLVVGALTRQPLLFLLAATSLLVALAAWLWRRYCFTGVTYRRLLSQRRAFFGEQIDLVLEVTNRKLLPLPWLEVEDEVPDGLTYPDVRLAPSYRPRRKTLFYLCTPRWYERVRRRYRIACTHRGLYEFGPATLRAGDLFGMSVQQQDVDRLDRLIVYPRIVPLERLGLPVEGPFGDLVRPRALWDDPTYAAGVRPYQAGDPLRRLHWKASARLGSLQIKLLEPTTHARLAVFLDMHTLAGHAWWAGYDPLLVELAVIVAASIAAWAAEQRLPLGLYANSYRFREAGAGTIAVPPSEHPEQLRRVLEALATVMPVGTLALADQIAAEAPGLPWGTTVLAISAVPDADLAACLETLRREGRSAALVAVGSRVRPPAATVPVFHVPGEEAWRDVAAVSLG